MALTANRNVQLFVAENEQYDDFPLGAGVHLYQGGFVGIDPAGYAKAFVPGDTFVGVAYSEVDNSSGLAGALYGRVIVGGVDFQHTLTSVALTDVGKPVFATADDTLALIGHPDAFVGRIVSYVTTNTCRVHLRESGERPHVGSSGALELVWDGARMLFSEILTAGNEQFTGAGFRLDAIGSGVTTGNGVAPVVTVGETKLLLEATSQAQNLTIETPYAFDITKGITAEFELRLKTAGGAATDDFDFGIAALSTTGLTDTQRADMDATTSGLKTAKFHLDCNANDIYFSSDDDASPVTATDTTVDNSLTTSKKFKIVARTTGAVEVWIDGVRKLSTTAFSVSTSGIFALFINLEKSTGTGVPEVRVRRARIAGAIA